MQAGEFFIFDSKSEPNVNCSFIEIVCSFFPILSINNLLFLFCFVLLFFMYCFYVLYTLTEFT